jgi:hypothetical protein
MLEALIGDLLELPYKGDVLGIGCDSMGVIGKYRGIRKDFIMEYEE